MSVSGDEAQSDLDAEFRQILYIIKPYITHINDHFHLEKYKVWLERLSEAGAGEKYERNKYLIELANQIHDNVIKPPFIFTPPRGPLPKLTSFMQQKPVEEVEWPYIPVRKSCPVETRCQSRHRESPVQRRKSKPRTVARPFQKLGKTQDVPKSETSSWCDLSESTTSVNLGSGDRDEEANKKVSEQHKQEGLKMQEHFIRQYEQSAKIHSESESVVSPPVDSTDDSSGRTPRSPTAEELEALKMRMQDLLEVKNALRDTHCLTEDRKKTVDNLHNKLVALEKQNDELKSQLEAERKKFAEMEKAKNKEISDFREKCTQLRLKEMEHLKQRHSEELKQLEKSHSGQITMAKSEIQGKFESVRKEYEEKMKSLSETHANVLKHKDEEINKLKSEIKIKEEPQNDNSSDQVIGLKKCISKLDKLLHKNEKDYVKKIEKLKQELEVRDMTTQVQLQTQRADLIIRNTAAKQEELKNALNSLESKYKKMMETLQIHALQAKQHDEKLIADLRSLLDKHHITY